MAARKPKTPAASAPKKPAKAEAKPLKTSQIKGKRLERNVTDRNAPVVQSSAGDLLKVLRDTGNPEAAADMVRRFADEADPNKPGYEGNEIVSNFVKAFQQLTTARRQQLLEAAGNPSIFAGLPQGFDPLEGAKLPSSPATLEEQLTAAIEEARANQPVVEEAPVDSAPTVESLARSASTFGGTKFRQAHRGEGRAPIDRNVPATIKDKETGENRPLTDKERAAAEKNLIKGIVGAKQLAQYDAIVEDGKTPMLPRMGKAGGRPSRSEMDAIERQNARTRPPGTSKASMDRLKGEVSRIRKLPVDPNVDPFAHVVDTTLTLTPEELNALPTDVRMAFRNGEINNLEELRAMSPEDITDSSSPSLGTTASPRFPIPGIVDKEQDISAKSAALSGRRTPYSSVAEQIAHRMSMEDTRYSDEGPAAVPSQEIKDNAIGRLKDQMADIRRRRAAYTENPSGPASGQADNLDTLTVGTLGVQGPYSKGMTADRQLSMSTQSPNDALMEAMYRAYAQMGLADESLDVGNIGEEGIRTVRDGGPASRPMDLNKIPEAFYHYAVPDEQGNLQLIPHTPTANFLADQMIDLRGIEDVDEFKRVAIPVLEASLAAHHRLGPQSIPAMKAASTVLVPSFDPRSNGYAFFSSPEGRKYMESAFDTTRPMARLKPSKFTGDMNATLGKPSAMSTDSMSLDDLLSMPADEAAGIDLRKFLDSPDTERPLDLSEPQDYQPLDVDEPNDLDSRFSAMPLRGGNGLNLPMNSARRGPLSGLIA
jgi:hypothetical protein